MLQSDHHDPIQFLDIQLVGQRAATALHFTDAGESLTWNGNVYFPLNFRRSGLEERMATQAGEVPALVITASNVDRQMATLLSRADVEGATATLTLADRRLLQNPRDAVQLLIGEARDLTLSEQTLTFQIVGVLGQQERIQIPRRVYQANCGYVFGDSPHCGVNINLSPITILSTVESGSTDRFILAPTGVLTEAGSPTKPNDFWDTGYIVMMNGIIGLQQRPIARVETFGGQLRFYLRYPLPAAPHPGDRIAIRRNCRLTKPDCAMFHDLPGQPGGDANQFGGFVEVPPVRFKPTEVPTPFNSAARPPTMFAIDPTQPLGVIPQNQPSPASLPSTLTLHRDEVNHISCPECPIYDGAMWNGVITQESGFVLYSFASLDPSAKTTFGFQTSTSSPPVLTPGILPVPTTVDPTHTSMWLLQCVLAWSNGLSTGNPGWVLRLYCGRVNTILDGGGLAPGTLAWEGELEGQNPAGSYARTGNSCSDGPDSISAS